MIKKGVTLLLSVFVLTVAWGENHYAPGKKNSLRAPSVPLVTSDPYFVSGLLMISCMRVTPNIGQVKSRL